MIWLRANSSLFGHRVCYWESGKENYTIVVEIEILVYLEHDALGCASFFDLMKLHLSFSICIDNFFVTVLSERSDH